MTPIEDRQSRQPRRRRLDLGVPQGCRIYRGPQSREIDDLADRWRAERTLDDRLQLAADLWRTDIHEARIAAAKLLTQARIRLTRPRGE